LRFAISLSPPWVEASAALDFFFQYLTARDFFFRFLLLAISLSPPWVEASEGIDFNHVVVSTFALTFTDFLSSSLSYVKIILFVITFKVHVASISDSDLRFS
jgi:hypothetical protein